MGFLSKLFGSKTVESKQPTKKSGNDSKAQQHGNMLIWCATCSREFFKMGEELGTKEFINCPKCGNPTPVKPYSPAQAVANRLAKAASDILPR